MKLRIQHGMDVFRTEGRDIPHALRLERETRLVYVRLSGTSTATDAMLHLFAKAP